MCSDLTRTIEFYRKLGFTESEQPKKQFRSVSAVVLERDGFSLECRLMRHWRLQEKEAIGDRKLEGTRVVFRVMSLEALHATFEKAGIPISSGIEKNYRGNTMEFEVSDPDDNKIIFLQGMFSAQRTTGIGQAVDNIRLSELWAVAPTLASMTKATDALISFGIVFAGQLLDMSPREIFQIPGIGHSNYYDLELLFRPFDRPLYPARGGAREYFLKGWPNSSMSDSLRYYLEPQKEE